MEPTEEVAEGKQLAHLTGNPAAVYAPGEDRAHLEMAEEVIDCVLTRVIEVVTESQRVASWTLAMTLDAAIEQAAAPHDAAEGVMGELIDQSVADSAANEASPAALQALQLPPVMWDAISSPAEVHSVEIADLERVVCGRGAWIFIQGVEVVEVGGQGRSWCFSGDSFMPSAGRGEDRKALVLRTQTDRGALAQLD